MLLYMYVASPCVDAHITYIPFRSAHSHILWHFGGNYFSNNLAW